MSTDTRPICRSICRPRVIVRLSADMSIDRLPTFRRYFTATFPGCLAWNITLEHVLRAMLATPRFSEDSLYKSGVVNRTNLTKNQLNSVEPNRPDCCSIGNNRAEIFRWVRLIELVRSITEVNNRTRLTRLLRFCLAKRQNPSSFNWIKIKIFILEVIWNR